ncbi:MAG: FGGY family carbohydrate kinase [Paracoccaceae bacterium]|nr:FGGY family carbohydrate kinase [Paracoccaceae bacterium]
MTIKNDNVAVIDIGKTSAKILVYDRNGILLDETRIKPKWSKYNQISELDVEHYWSWINSSLERFSNLLNVKNTIVTGHGCTFAIVRNGVLALPILDYENEPPEEIKKQFEVIQPSFAETLTPRLPMGLNYAVHIFWRHKMYPSIIENCDAILPYPQYWIWKLTGYLASEISYLGCHSFLWSPKKNQASSLSKHLGWERKFPKMHRAGEILGQYKLKENNRSINVHNGLHDSNANLYFYKALGYKNFTLISTGTWVVIFNTDTSIQKLNPDRDMLGNITVDNQPIATARFMGGRDFDIISDSYRSNISIESINEIMKSDRYALPSFTGGGPFPGRLGKVIGPEIRSAELSAALATIYLVCMTKTVIDLLESKNTIIIDGGFANNQFYTILLKELCIGQNIFCNESAEGTSLGAAILAFENMSGCSFSNPCTQVEPTGLKHINKYYETWTELIATENSL